MSFVRWEVTLFKRDISWHKFLNFHKFHRQIICWQWLAVACEDVEALYFGQFLQRSTVLCWGENSGVGGPLSDRNNLFQTSLF